MRRRALLLLVALAVAACGGDDDDATVATTTTVAPGATTVTAGTGAGGNGAGPGPTVATVPGGGPATTVGSAGTPPPPTDGSPGSGAPFFLRPAPADTVVLEISAEDGAAPSAGTTGHLASVLGDVTHKPVETTAGGTPPARETWTADQLRAAADATAVAAQGRRAVLRLLFVHGRWADDDNVLGISVRADVAAIFSDRVDAAADPIVGAGAIEVAVATHEVGHLLGLVDLYRKTGREDPEHPGHSTNRDSVMYWAVESTLVTDLLAGGPPRDFDAADLADLAAIRDGG